MVKMMFALVLAVVTVSSAKPFAQQQDTRDWHVGADRVNPRGTVVHGHANIPIHRDSNNKVDGNVHGSRVFGGPYNGQSQAGVGARWEGRNGWNAGADVTRSWPGETRYGVSVGKRF